MDSGEEFKIADGAITSTKRRRSARLSTKVQDNEVKVKSYVNSRKNNRVMGASAKGTNKKIRVTNKRKVRVARGTTTKRRRVSSSPTNNSECKKETVEFSKKGSFSKVSTGPEEDDFARHSSVVTPCTAKTQTTLSSKTGSMNLNDSPSYSCSSSSQSSMSLLTFSSHINLPENVVDIDKYFMSPRNYPDSDHNSEPVTNNSYMRDYGREQFFHLCFKERAETTPPSDITGKSTFSCRVTRSKRKILNGSSSSSVSCYSQLSDSNKNKRLPIREPFFDYMKTQPYLSFPMRTLLIDWFVELSEEYKLKPETLHLAVKVLDRALAKSETRDPSELENGSDSDGTDDLLSSDEEDDESAKKDGIDRRLYKGFIVRRQMLQCVGCACMLIATKLEEIKPPTSKDFSYISDSTYTPMQITRMEMKICTHLQFRLRGVTPMMYFHRFLRASQEGDSNLRSEVLELLCLYILELSLLEYELVGARSSLIMAGVIYLARATLGIRSKSVDVNTGRRVGEFWNPTLEFYTGYEMWELDEVVKILHKLQLEAEEREDGLRSIFNKYKKKEYKQVALRTVLRRTELGF